MVLFPPLFPLRTPGRRLLSLRLFPPRRPSMRRAGFNCTTSQAGNSLEIYVEHWLAQRFPAAAISHKQLLHIPSLGHFECAQ